MAASIPSKPASAAAGWPDAAALSTSIYCGDEVIAIGIDVDDAALAEQVYNVAASYLGRAPTRYRDGSARRLLVYRNGEPKRRYKTISAGDGRKVDFLSGDHYFVADGLHPDGMMYAWNAVLKDWPVASLVAVTAEQVEAFRDTAANILGGGSCLPRNRMPQPSTWRMCQRIANAPMQRKPSKAKSLGYAQWGQEAAGATA